MGEKQKARRRIRKIVENRIKERFGTKARFAREIKISPQQLCNILSSLNEENEKIRAKGYRYRPRIAKALGMEMDEIWGED